MKNGVLLNVSGLSVKYESDLNLFAVQDISIRVNRNSALGIVGESGSGKTTLLNVIMRLLPDNAEVQGSVCMVRDTGEIHYTSSEWQSLFGRDIAFIPQSPKSALDPTYKIGSQLIEAIKVHSPKKDRLTVQEEILKVLKNVGISDPKLCIKQYPHELSGGMCQRVLLAMAILSNPKLILADEPTTALDATTQVQIIKLLNDLKKSCSMIFVTHDIGLALLLCDEICVMHSGKILESANAEEIFDNPKHPYTKELLRSINRTQRDSVEKMDNSDGCDYYPYCKERFERCRREKPHLIEDRFGHATRCWCVSELNSRINKG